MTVGDVFGRLTVIELLPGADRPVRVASRARVRCACGTETVAQRNNLRSGNTTSCGCLRLELLSSAPHGLAHGQAPRGRVTPEYRAWTGAKRRTTNPNNPRWADYGGRGISMADEWLHDFAAFLAHVGPRPGPGYTLDRIDNDGHYEPGNVRWATWKEQAHNRRPGPGHDRRGRWIAAGVVA